MTISETSDATDGAVGDTPTRVTLLDVDFDLLCTEALSSSILEASRSGAGGWLLTPNLSIMRQMRRSELDWVSDEATHVVPDGQPLQWLAWAAGVRLGPRVTGSDVFRTVMESLPRGTTVLLIGGPARAIERAADKLTSGGVHVVADAPPVGFDATDSSLSDYCAAVTARLPEQPDLVALALPFPRQERVARELRTRIPNAYYLNTGAAVTFWTGVRRRAPAIFGSLGLEWAFRLVQDPRRLARRYLLEDAPFLVTMWVSLLRHRWGRPLGIRRFSTTVSGVTREPVD